MDNRSTVATKVAVGLDERSIPQPQHTETVAAVNEKLVDHKTGEAVGPPEGFAANVAHKARSFFKYLCSDDFIAMMCHFIALMTNFGTKPNVQPSSHCMSEAKQNLNMQLVQSTPCLAMPIPVTPRPVYAGSACVNLYKYHPGKRRKNAFNQHTHVNGNFSRSLDARKESLQNELQDIGSLMRQHYQSWFVSLSASCEDVRAVPVSLCNPQQSIPAKKSFSAVPSIPDTVNTIIDDQENQKCDIDSNRAEFTDYECSDDQSDNILLEDEDDDGESDRFEDEDDDDESVVFCDDYDDLNDDSNSSSGFEEKKVRFNLKPVCHIMRAWNFAYRQARKGDWEMAARDNERFRKRIADLEPLLRPALETALRDKVYAERFSSQEHTRKILN